MAHEEPADDDAVVDLTKTVDATARHVDRDSAAGERAVITQEQVVDEREVAAACHEHTGLVRVEPATIREGLLREREKAAEVRDVLAAARDSAAAARDRVARRRDALAIKRDRRTAHLDRLVAAHQSPAEGSEVEHNRQAVGVDRAHSAADRVESSVHRSHARADREASADDRRAAAEERVSSSVDELTGAMRRGPGLAELQRDIDRARRDDGQLVVGFIDVDGLKAVNDVHGHAAGDALLAAVAAALRANLRSYDTVLRYGGDEFVCVLSGASLADANARLAATNSVLATAVVPGSVTVGLTDLRPDDSAEGVVRRADVEFLARRAENHRPV